MSTPDRPVDPSHEQTDEPDAFERLLAEEFLVRLHALASTYKDAGKELPFTIRT